MVYNLINYKLNLEVKLISNKLKLNNLPGQATEINSHKIVSKPVWFLCLFVFGFVVGGFVFLFVCFHVKSVPP